MEAVDSLGPVNIIFPLETMSEGIKNIKLSWCKV